MKRYWAMGGNTLAEADGSGNLTAEYIYFGIKRIARIDLPANTVHYYLSDHLGSTSVVASATGTVEEESDYYPFGTEVNIVGPGVNELKFASKRRDSETGFDVMGARFYSNVFGRFTKPDPLILQQQKLLDPQQWGMYQYARGNPLSAANSRASLAVASVNAKRFAMILPARNTWAHRVAPIYTATARKTR